MWHNIRINPTQSDYSVYIAYLCNSLSDSSNVLFSKEKFNAFFRNWLMTSKVEVGTSICSDLFMPCTA